MRKILLALCLLFAIASKAQVERINVQNITKNPNGYIEIQSIFKAKIPTRLVELPDFEINAQALYGIDSIEVIGGEEYAVFNLTISMTTYRVVNGFTTVNLTNLDDVKYRLQHELDVLEANLESTIPLPFGGIKDQIYIDSLWINQ